MEQIHSANVSGGACLFNKHCAFVTATQATESERRHVLFGQRQSLLEQVLVLKVQVLITS